MDRVLPGRPGQQRAGRDHRRDRGEAEGQRERAEESSAEARASVGLEAVAHVLDRDDASRLRAELVLSRACAGPPVLVSISAGFVVAQTLQELAARQGPAIGQDELLEGRNQGLGPRACCFDADLVSKSASGRPRGMEDAPCRGSARSMALTRASSFRTLKVCHVIVGAQLEAQHPVDLLLRAVSMRMGTWSASAGPCRPSKPSCLGVMRGGPGRGASFWNAPARSRWASAAARTR